MTIPIKLGPAFVLLLLLTRVAAVRSEDWPQWRGPNRNGEWSESGIFETFPTNGLKESWRAAVGIGFSSPVVADGRVFVTDSELAKPKASERVHAFDAITGQKLWSYSYDVNYPDGAFDERSLRGPIATPIVNDGRIYTLGASGKVFSLEAAKGDVLWQKDLKQEYPESDLYPSPSPLIEGDLLILLVGAKPGASVVAFNKNTGELVWKALDEEASASSPIVVSAAGKRQLIVWTPQSVTALNPATGTTYWRQRLNTTQDATVSTPVCYNGNLLIGGLMLKLDSEKPGATVLWPKSRATARRILSDTSTAMFRDAYIYSARSSGEFVCLEASTGNQLWETDKVTDLKSGASIHVTANGNSALLYSDRGDLIRTQLTPKGNSEISRARVLEPAVTFSGRKTAWAAPAFANQCIYARTNKELVCVSLAAEP